LRFVICGLRFGLRISDFLKPGSGQEERNADEPEPEGGASKLGRRAAGAPKENEGSNSEQQRDASQGERPTRPTAARGQTGPGRRLLRRCNEDQRRQSEENGRVAGDTSLAQRTLGDSGQGESENEGN
jgi:hypothetical protein